MSDHRAASGIVAVTGASGFVGRAIVRTLVARGVTVRALSRATRGLPEGQGPAAVIGDLAGPVEWDRVLDGVDAVVHAAGLARQERGVSDRHMFRVNADATGGLAGAARRCGVGRLVVVSSVRAVCGATSEAIVTDATPASPTDAYGRSKLAGEEAALASGLGVAILRPVIVHGSGAQANMASLARLAASTWPLPFANLGGLRSILSDDNLADAVAFLVASPGLWQQRFLVADAAPMSVGAMLAAMRTALGRSPQLFGIPRSSVGALLGALGRGASWDRLTGNLVVACTGLVAAGWTPPEASHLGLTRMVKGVIRGDHAVAAGRVLKKALTDG